MKLEIIAPVEGKSWKVGHTVLIDDAKAASKMIKDGFAIQHPTVTDPAPTHECPCKEKEEPCDDPCDECKEKEKSNDAKPSKKAPKKRKKTNPLKN